jgi:hypothetical protein
MAASLAGFGPGGHPHFDEFGFALGCRPDPYVDDRLSASEEFLIFRDARVHSYVRPVCATEVAGHDDLRELEPNHLEVVFRTAGLTG